MAQPWYPLCPNLPTGEGAYLFGVVPTILKGQPFNLHETGWAITNVIAYSQTKLPLTTETAMKAKLAKAPALTKANQAKLLEGLDALGKSGGEGMKAFVIPWALFAELLPILLEIIRKRAGG